VKRLLRSRMAEQDVVLFAVRNAFYLGAYATCVEEAEDMEELSEAQRVERDCYVYRSHIAQGNFEAVLGPSGIQDDAPTAVLAVRLLAQYDAVPDLRGQVVEEIKSWLEDDACKSIIMVQTVAGLLFSKEQDWGEALKACHGARSLEQHAVCVQAYLGMDRPDKALEQVKKMEEADEDATLTQLCQAWVGMEMGGRLAGEAGVIFQDLGDRYFWTPQMHTWRAVAKMRTGRFDEAEESLKEAMEMDAKFPDALANGIICALHLGKPTAPLVQQLGAVAPGHLLLQRVREAEEAFAQAASAFA